MADDTVKKLLIKLGISTSDWKTAVNDIKRQLDSVNTQAKADAVSMKKTQQEQLDLTKQQISEQQRLTAEAKTLAAIDQAKAQWQRQQQEAIKTQVQQRILETAELKKQAVEQQASLKFEQEQLRLAQMRYKLQQQQRSEQLRQTKASGGSGGGGILGGLAGMLGGGPVGMIAAGASLGNVVSESAMKLLDSAVSAVHKLGDALLEATGPAAQLREQFEKLTKRAGISPDEYINKLRAATRGLVEDTALYRIANNYMQQGIKVSTDEIARLIKATVDLARAQGKDATVAVQALERASKTGRAQILAMVTGLTRQELQLRGVSQAMDATTRNTLQFTQVLNAMEARLKAVGTPATTLPELFKQWDTVQKNLVDDLAISITQSKGYKDILQGLSNLITELQPKLSALVVMIGKNFGDALEIVIPLVKLFVATGKLVFSVSDAFGKVTASILGFSTQISSLPGKAGPFRKFVAEMSMGFLTLAEYVNETAIKIAAVGDIVDAVLNKKFAQARAAYKGMKADLEESRQDYLKNMVTAVTFGLGKDEETPAAGKQQDIDPNITKARMLQKLQLELAKEENKLELELTQERLKSEEQLVKRSYEQGIIDLEAKVVKEKQIYLQEHAAKLAQIEADRLASVDNIRRSGKESGLPSNIIEKQVEQANVRAQVSTVSENTSFSQKFGGAEDQGLQDKQNAYRKYTSELTKIAQEGVQTRLAVLEKEFQGGRVDADKYLIDKRDLINQEFLATRDGLNKQLAAAKGNATEQQTITDQITQAKMKAEKELTLMTEGEYDIRLKAADNKFNQEKQILQLAETQTQTQAKRGVPGAGGSQIQIEEQLRQLTAQHIAELQRMRSPLEAGSEQWIKISEEIQKSSTELTQIQEKLTQMKNISAPLGGIFGALGGLAGSFPGRTASGISQMFGSMQQSSQDIGVFTNANQAVKQQHDDTGTGPSNIISQLGSNFKGLFDATKPLADRLNAFGNSLSAVVSGIEGMVKAGSSSKSGGEGALKGGMAGMQAGSVAGPWGMLIGGVAGATMGGIFGAKEKALQQDIHKITTQLQSIVSDMQAGTISMAQGLADLRTERQQAIAILSQDPKGNKGGGKGGKKGYTPSQAQAVIQQIDQQIQAVVNQQTQILQNLSSSLMQLSQPIQFQQYIQSLNTIIQQYQQFTSAAQGNAQEVAAANQYLNDSLQQYVTTLSQNLNQAQQTAINDALTLINLEYQRQQLINQTAQQEYDIMSQGVLTRQRTTAMTKGQEIGVLQYQRDMQLEQMNEEISLQQYKVSSEQQIFGLATTRIGLETQLLEAQEEQADYQIAQVQALAQVVASLQGGLATGQTMQQIESLMAGGTMPTGPGILYTLLQELGLSGNVPTTATQGQYGTQNWLANVPPIYASAAQYVASLDPSFVQQMMSGQYSQAAAAVQPYVTQGEVEGYDMTGFESWLESGGTTNASSNTPNNPNGVPGYASGTTTPVSGPMMVGEGGPEIFNPSTSGTILPSPIVGLLNAFNGGSISPVGTPDPEIGLGTSKLDVENQLVTMTNYRVSMEMNVVQARTTLLGQESNYLSALQDFYDTLQTQGSSSSNFEAMLQKVYETRGRYGSGNFRRELL